MNLKLISLTLAGSIGSFATSLSASVFTAVDFGADYTSSNINASVSPTVSDVDADFDGLADDRVAMVAFGTQFSPPNSASWNTPVGKSGGVILHGVSVALLNWNSGTDPQPALGLNRISSADIIQATNGAGTASLRMASAYYWEKSSFINGGASAGALSFANDAASISATFNNSGTPTNAGGRLSRALVESNGSWYVSAEVYGGTTGTIQFNGAATDWYAFDPAANSLFLNVGDLGAPLSGSLLTDITAMGIYSQIELANGTAGNAVIQGFSSLQVAMVPEPSTYALISGVLVLFLAIRRRRR